jgi:hypothetical protein
MVSDTPTDGRCNWEYDDGGYCEGHPMDNGRCFHHGGQRENGGAPEGNTNAVDVGAWAEDFYQDFLTEAEKDRIHESAQALRDEATAQEIASHAASVCLEQFRRTGDERFMRRYESICDTFGLAPADEVSVDASHEHDFGDDVTAEFVTFEAGGDDGDE